MMIPIVSPRARRRGRLPAKSRWLSLFSVCGWLARDGHEKEGIR